MVYIIAIMFLIDLTMHIGKTDMKLCTNAEYHLCINLTGNVQKQNHVTILFIDSFVSDNRFLVN